MRHWGFVRRELEEHGISERCQLSPVPLRMGSRWRTMPVGAAHNGKGRQGIGIAGEQYNGVFRRLKGQHISGINFQVFGKDEKLVVEQGEWQERALALPEPLYGS